MFFNISFLDPNADLHARLIADAAVRDAESKMKNVIQPPPLNTASTFTVRSSSNPVISSGPPVMVLQPGGSFAVKKPGAVPVSCAEKQASVPAKPVLTPGKPVSQLKNQVSQSESRAQGTKETGSFGFNFTRSINFTNFSNFGTGGATGNSGAANTGVGNVFDSGSKIFGHTGPLGFGSTGKGQPSSSVVQSPSREEGMLIQN